MPAPVVTRAASAPPPAVEPREQDAPTAPEAEPAPREPAPLSDELRTALASIRPDPPPRAITRQRHYFTSNEAHPHLYRDVVAGLGGLHVGVGAEQNYLFAGWAKSDIVVCLDFDQWIVDLHEVYGLLFDRAESAEEFVALWAYKRRKDVDGWAKARWPKHEDRWRKTRAYGAARAEVEKRLSDLQRRHRALGVASFVSDDDQFRWVKSLWRAGRVLAVRGDLTQDRAMADLSAFAKRAGVPVRSVYLSNAEDYFRFSSGKYRDNVLGLPFDEKSVVLRTKPRHGDHYEYLHQRGLGFQAWLRAGRVDGMCELSRFTLPAPKAEDENAMLLEIGADPAAEPSRRHLCD